jgi:hypothetical protein
LSKRMATNVLFHNTRQPPIRLSIGSLHPS